MPNMNKVILIGHAARDAEVRMIASGDKVANFTIATTERWKGKDGEKKERTEWNQCVAWKKTADIAEESVKKGSLCIVEGKLQTRDWKDSAGVKHYRTEIVADWLQVVQKDNTKPPQSGYERQVGDDEDELDIPF